MAHEEVEELASLRQEVRTLRVRVAELQRRAARFSDEEEQKDFSGVKVSISAREELLIEAERIAHMGSWVWDVEQNTVFWSEELFRILGYDPETDAASVDAFFARIHPDDLERVQALSAQGASEGVAKQMEHRIVRPDGAVRYVVTDGAMLFDAAGKLRRIVGTVLDQTAFREASLHLRRANDQLEQAQQIAHLGSWSMAASTRKVQWSRETYRIMGIDPSVPATEERYFDSVHPEDRERLERINETALREKREAEVDARIVRPSGEIRHVRMKGVPVLDAKGELEEMRGTMLDVTTLVELRERLAHAEKMEAVGRLAGGIAHDFNNLLTVITGNLGLLAATTDTPAEEIEESLRAVHSAKALTQRLLAFGRKAQLYRKSVDPNDLVRSALGLLHRVIGDQIQIVAEFGQDLGRIEVDPTQIEQSLINLVTNARDALPNGGSVKLSTRRVAGDDGEAWVEIAVTDDGAGMDDETLRSIFEPFYTTKEAGRGTGLGLAMVLGTIEQHGGSVKVESAPGRGSTFRLRLPTARQAEPFRAPSAPPVEGGPETLPARILVVEDQPKVAQVMARILKNVGHDVVVAETPLEAQRLFESEPPFEVIVCDIVMPEVRGPDLIERLREKAGRFEVLFVTGYSEEMVDSDLGAAVLAKPFTPNELRAAVQGLLEQRETTASQSG